VSATETRIPLAHAEAIAADLVELISPGSEITIVAGSVRRRRPLVKDIELLVIAKTVPLLDLFGDVIGEQDLLDKLMRAWLKTGHFQPRLDVTGRQAIGKRYKRMLFRDVPVDLFTATPDNWGLQLALRTGPAEFSKRLVTRTAAGGLLPFGYWVGKEGADPERPSHLWLGQRIVPTPTEESLFEAIGVDWIEPEDRG